MEVTSDDGLASSARLFRIPVMLGRIASLIEDQPIFLVRDLVPLARLNRHAALLLKVQWRLL